MLEMAGRCWPGLFILKGTLDMTPDPMDDIWGELLAPASKQPKTEKENVTFKTSGTLLEASYDKMMQTMVVRFRSGAGAYSYFNVPPHIASGLFGCEEAGISAGKYFIKEIKNVYPFKKIK